MSKIVMRFPGGLKKAVTLSYDDGVEQDIRLIEIMNEHGLKGTFNLNSGRYAPEGTVYPPDRIHRVMTKSQTTQLYAESGMEVATHGLNHPFLEELTPDIRAYEIVKDRENLEEQFGTIVRGHAYPFGTFDDAVIDSMKELGIAYARTVKSTHSFDIPKQWLLWDPTCHHKDPRLMELARAFVDKQILYKPWLFYLWGHSYEFEKDSNWHVIEEFARYIGGREDIWYATNIQIHDYVQSYRRLRCSVSGSRIFNPTSQPIWFEAEFIPYCVQPGETLELNGTR